MGACATAPPPTEPPLDQGTRLRALLAASDEATLDRNPIFALYRGDTRRAAQHGDYVSQAYVDGERQAAESDLAQLAQIPRAQLSPIDRVAYDTFRWSRNEWRERHAPPASSVWPLVTLDHMTGWHLFFPDLSSGTGVAPYRSVADYDAGLSRIEGFIGWLGLAVERMREGQRSGVVLPRVVVERVTAQFDRFAEQGIADSPYFGPIRTFPADLPAADKERLTRAYTAAVEGRLRPAFRRVQSFLADEYLPAARATVGLSGVPGGAAYYDFLIRSNTTTTMSAEEVHRLGQAEVSRITAGMTAVMLQVAFQGSLAQFFEHLRTDPRFAPASAQALADGYTDIGRRVASALPRLFDAEPKTPLAIRPTPDYQAPTDAGARYNSGSLDTGQPGVFFFNTYDLPSRRVWGMETLYLHEATPGHHMQSALAAENLALPKLLRFDGNTAYNEGWALYAESLGFELGLFQDPYQRFGHYDDEMLRAMRLVVDTGLHAYGWTRERAIDYLLAHSAMSRTDAVAEVERYIANPGQALAYKIGALTIQRLRRQAEQALGARFDVRAFHRQVLETGSVPMAVLEAKIVAWIAAR
ncbi:MAG: hypothetical protein AD742_10655 [Methylibium sp. NZG]|nr:MAG: hypothetical protein AD742_10655 [Methylibium sp. NZG]